ncbi:tyrosine-type recombinase/integrase [Quadrisphaera setariae]|uniref:Tyrosine-type recombinase/integrase n=1 Tax=Quadrisphaera setariae TaxID=2593304 RepID=A0A5C8Z2W0_9ACTN|nr:tyrosine-type recombinase/integrase [Quadrisphaera setariae]
MSTPGVLAGPAASGELPALSGPAYATVAGFLLAYTGTTRAAYAGDLRHYLTWTAALTPATGFAVDPLQLTRAHVDAYATDLAACGMSPATIARRLAALAGFYAYAVEEGHLERSPAARVRRPKVGEHTTSTGLDRAELSALISAAEADGPRSLAAVLLLGLNGLRVSEVAGARAEHLGTERGHQVLVITRKGGRTARVPLAPRTATAVDAYLAGRTHGPLLVTRTGAGMDRHAIWRLLRRLARDAVPDKAASIHPHDLRHTFVTLSLDAGASLRDVQDAAGHADPRTTRRYDRARHHLDRHPTYALAGLIS